MSRQGTGRVEQTIAAMHAFLDEEVLDAPFRALSRRLVGGAARQAEEGIAGVGWVPYIDLAFDVTAAAGGDAALAPLLAAATAFVFSGLDVIDDIADGDCQPQWQGVPVEQQTLAGLAALASYPQALLARLPLLPGRIATMQARSSRALLLTCGGQHMDLALRGAEIAPPDAVEAATAGKSGEQLALYCAWAATAAGASAEQVEAYATFGRGLGTVGQINSDVTELCHEEWCRDLATGTRTLAIAYHLARCGDGRPAFLDLLERARSDREAQQQVRQAVMVSGAVRMAAITAGLHAHRARRALGQAAALEPGRSRLHAMLDSLAARKPVADRTA